MVAGEGQVLLRPAEDEQHQHALLQRGHDRHPRQAPQHEGRPLRLRLMRGRISVLAANLKPAIVPLSGDTSTKCPKKLEETQFAISKILYIEL